VSVNGILAGVQPLFAFFRRAAEAVALRRPRLDDAVAESYGRLGAWVVEVGRQPRGRSLDLMMAATAHAHGARLYTRNPDDFRGLEDLVEVVSL
jgi:predicted nucleic acid-binding protein